MPPPTAAEKLHKHACSLCSRRKVKCDKGDPCANCVKAQAQCAYEAPAPPRPRKRAADEDLLARIALYEDLMRKQNIDFTHHANTWVSPWSEPKLKESNSEKSASVTSATSPSSKDNPSENYAPNKEQYMWHNLSSELKHPPIHILRHNDDPSLHPTPSLEFIITNTESELHLLHPEPRHIYRLWQTFVENVNPLTKIIHVPTLQRRILDASGDPANVSKPLSAILFAIYTLSVTSMSSADCQASFGETRGDLLTRYRAATVRALIAADFLTTKELEVLEAFYLFLIADPDSGFNSTLTGAAVRLAQKMGLHRENGDTKISFFEKEMRIRLWWQLCGLDSRVHAFSAHGAKPVTEVGDVRLPLNVNDADLHPDMTEAPIEHNNPTEMMCVLMKYEVSNWLRSSPRASQVFDNIIRGNMRGKRMVELQDEAINELEANYQLKYFRNCDKRIPLHNITQAMAKLAIARMRFRIHHPRGRAISGYNNYMNREESNMLFNSAVTSLEMAAEGFRSKFSSHLVTHLTSNFEVDAYIYVISDLRWRCSGERVSVAWKLVEDIYTDHPELIDDTENTFFVALGDLTLEAWEERRKELVCSQGAREYNATPQFIQLLWDKRQTKNKESFQIPTVLDTYSHNSCLVDDGDFDWDYWTEILRF
ncbi:hypothetical protein G7Z17_g2113 [Cylindrodendrum hubeiense]|uniref:Zn(2)-C6 fungal-type domain-containing protein n=1 Tax=Cylindrodendrum hubeiense TaxID=595255 RepID=A0A9P5HI70_9HYPO|nr:hypothetical protein G7Z17_g2113 [Cylindrodendrum hubeiense]